MQYSLNSEQQLLEGLAVNDRKTTEQVYRENYKPVAGLDTGAGGTADDGEDVFHEAMVILFQKAQQEEFRLTCKIGTYLVAVAKFIWYKNCSSSKDSPIFCYRKKAGKAQDRSMRMRMT